MKKGRYQKEPPKRIPMIMWIFVAVIIVLLIGVLLSRNQGDTTSLKSSFTSGMDSDTAIEKNPDSIAIPGYEMIQLVADTKKQTLSFPNPPQNMCYFQISLLLEDGTMLWESDLIEPGKTSKPIVLTKPLGRGTYPNSILRYSCFSMDDERSPLNGAETKLTLLVK